jgi:TIR domain
MAGGKIFINYRRDDSRADSGRLYDRLNARYPNRVFRDVGSLEPGVEWHEAIERVLGSSDACVVVIGKEWLDIAGPTGTRRLDDPRDTVRQEIVTALKRGMRVFPVLVGGAKMPPEEELPEDLHSLARRNALEITEQDWDQGFEKLADAIDRTLGVHHAPPPPPPKASRAKPVLIGAGGLVAAVVIAIAVYNSTQKPPVTVIREEPGASSSVPSNAPIDQPKSPATGSTSGASPVSDDPGSRRAPSGSSLPPASSGSEPPVISEPPPPQINPSRFVGNWRALVTGPGQQLLESIDLHPDSSFHVTLNGASAAVGRWQYNAAEDTIDVVNAVNFLNNGAKFVCKLKNQTGAGFAGPCLDQTQLNWTVAMTHQGKVSEEIDNIPRLDVSSLTLAEKQAFAQVLALSPCTCGCNMTILACLHNDRNCNVSPALAETQLATFLAITRR